MESLVGYSVDNFMHAHQQFEGDLQRLEDRISDVGKVDVSFVNLMATNMWPI